MLFQSPRLVKCDNALCTLCARSALAHAHQEHLNIPLPQTSRLRKLQNLRIAPSPLHPFQVPRDNAGFGTNATMITRLEIYNSVVLQSQHHYVQA